MSTLISNLYKKVLSKERIFTKRTLSEAYKLILEDTTQFTANNIQSSWVPWTPLQRNWYDKLKAQEVFNDESIGPGEVSVAIAILQAARPDFDDQKIMEDLSKITQGSYGGFDVRKSSVLYQMVNHIGPKTVDIYDILNKKFYEVKQASDKKPVMVGKESRGPALTLYNTIKNDFENLYATYNKLSSEHKALIEQFKGPNIKTMTFEKIMTVGHEYFTNKPGELARGCIIQLQRPSPTPKLFLIPSFLTEEFFLSPTIKDVIPDAVSFIKDLYGVDTLDARIIDKNARDYVERKRKVYFSGEPVSVDPETALSDFALFAQLSIFASKEIFFEKVVSYFIPGENNSNKVLAQMFPNEGMFAVDPELGYLYAGKQHLGSLLRVDNITKGIFKVVPIDAPESTDAEDK